jgi:hypothetical protein
MELVVTILTKTCKNRILISVITIGRCNKFGPSNSNSTPEIVFT